MKRRLDIAVAGAGPAGLASALYLHRAGHRVTLFERFDQPRPIGSGLMLQPTGQAVLADLGLLDRVAALGQPIDQLLGTDARSGRTVLDVRYAALGRHHAYGIHRAALFDALHDAVRAEGIAVVTGFSVERAEGADKVTLISGTRREGPFDLVVDASGASSTLPAASGSAVTPRPLHYGAVWATLPWPEAGFSDRALTQRYRHASVMIGVMPAGKLSVGGAPVAAFFWSLKPEELEGIRRAGLEAWKEQVASHWPETRVLLEQIRSFDDMTLARYAHHTMSIPADGGVVFVGDSAHATSPQLGQGANMALIDAKALAVALERTESLEDAVGLYAGYRRWHVRFYQALSLVFTPLYQSDGRVLPLLRDTLVSTIGRLPPVQMILAGMVAGRLLRPLSRLGLRYPQ